MDLIITYMLGGHFKAVADRIEKCMHSKHTLLLLPTNIMCNKL